jgi:hypothetical protein
MESGFASRHLAARHLDRSFRLVGCPGPCLDRTSFGRRSGARPQQRVTLVRRRRWLPPAPSAAVVAKRRRGNHAKTRGTAPSWRPGSPVVFA